MNTLIINKVRYKYEGLWRDNIKRKILDSNNKLLPFPIENTDEWDDKTNFVSILLDVQQKLHNHKNFIFYKKNETFNKDCIICGKKNITHGIYSINNIRWETGFKHYIKKHNIVPSDEFIDFIYRYSNVSKAKSKVIGRINGKKVIKSDKKYLRIDRNQILIMDALMIHGGQKIYGEREFKRSKDNKLKKYKYSEHTGLLDFNNTGLEKIIVSGNTTRVSPDDDDIFLPKNMIEALDYEYIFHTHPPTPVPGARSSQGILYEFPSISDIFHFIDHYNEGRTQGSIVIAPEGMYIIRKKDTDDKKIDINEDKFYKQFIETMWKSQESAIGKYGTEFSLHTFYSVIAQDKKYIKNLNKILNKYKLHIDYHARIKDTDDAWVIDTIYLPVYSIEYKL
ncbi:hypothetical protein Indivirus_4_36 [Indivirus ILV1]|uniref:Uncharacterized protein n=1 Tax=Indivirus ILV1 TaxID=1977633 RepID=A0A1V0SDZ9_9VIRU|nr:hypothetical protein Indivirus_4_36 [Indivirus ILV1]